MKQSVKDCKQKAEAEHETLENMEDPITEINPLEVNTKQQLNGEITEISLLMTTGGPRVEIHLVGEEIKVSWGSGHYTKKIESDEARETVNTLWDMYSSLATANPAKL